MFYYYTAGYGLCQYIEIRPHGFRPGINLLATIGHHPEDLDYSIQGEYRPMTNIHGDTCAGSYCIPIGNGCFCAGCIDLFNRTNGTSYTRESLKAALDREDIPLRQTWLRHQSDSIIRLFREIGKTVRAVSEDITLGFMTGERYFEGYDFAGFADALSDGRKYNIG